MSHDDHENHHVNYLVVFFVLCGFTALSVVFDVMHFENHAVTIVLVMAVAVAKALCVMMFVCLTTNHPSSLQRST